MEKLYSIVGILFNEELSLSDYEKIITMQSENRNINNKTSSMCSKDSVNLTDCR